MSKATTYEYYMIKNFLDETLCGFLSKPQQYPTAFAIKLQLNTQILKHIYIYSRSFTNDDNIFFQEWQTITVFTKTSFFIFSWLYIKDMSLCHLRLRIR